MTRAGHTRAILWGDVDYVVQTARVATLDRVAAKIGDKVVVTLRGNNQIQLNYMVKRIGSLIARIQKGVGDAQTLQALHAWQAGETVSFGPLAIVRVGISNGVDTVEWRDIGRVTYAFGYVQIRRASTGMVAMAAPVASVRILGVLLEVMSRIREI